MQIGLNSDAGIPLSDLQCRLEQRGERTEGEERHLSAELRMQTESPSVLPLKWCAFSEGSLVTSGVPSALWRYAVCVNRTIPPNGRSPYT